MITTLFLSLWMGLTPLYHTIPTRVHFAPGSTTPREDEAIVAVAQTFQLAGSRVYVGIVGRCDRREARSCAKLGKARAEVVRARLVALGVPAERLRVAAETPPAVATEAERQELRSVRFELLGVDPNPTWPCERVAHPRKEADVAVILERAVRAGDPRVLIPLLVDGCALAVPNAGALAFPTPDTFLDEVAATPWTDVVFEAPRVEAGELVLPIVGSELRLVARLERRGGGWVLADRPHVVGPGAAPRRDTPTGSAYGVSSAAISDFGSLACRKLKAALARCPGASDALRGHRANGDELPSRAFAAESTCGTMLRRAESYFGHLCPDFVWPPVESHVLGPMKPF